MLTVVCQSRYNTRHSVIQGLAEVKKTLTFGQLMLSNWCQAKKIKLRGIPSFSSHVQSRHAGWDESEECQTEDGHGGAKRFPSP